MSARVQVRKVARQGTGHTPSRSVPEYWTPNECTIPWLTLADVWKLRDGSIRSLHDTAEKISPLGVANSSAVVHPAGTVAFSRTASVGYSCILGVDMATSQDFVTWTPGPRLTSGFLLWALRGLREEIVGRTQGSTHKTIYMPDLEQVAIPLPSLEDQRRIVAYLDHEVSRLDELLAAKQQMVAALVARKASVMLEAVSGATTVPGTRRPSGLYWTPDLPAHWPTVLLRLVAATGSGHTPSRDRPEWWVDCTIPWITTGEVAQVRSDEQVEISETRECISELGLANSSAAIHPKGTVVLCRTAASAGYSALMGTDMATSQDFATWTCGALLRPRYLLLCLRAMRPDLLGRLATGSTHKTIYMPDLHGLRIPLPPLEEQDRVVDQCFAELGQVFEARHLLADQIELLQERRRSLITAVVTGEMEVP